MRGGSVLRGAAVTFVRRWFPRRRIVLLGGMATAVAIASLVSLALLVVVWIAGGLAPGPYLQWEAVGALAQVSAGVAAAATLALLAAALPDIERNAQDSKVERGPYVRVDVLPARDALVTDMQSRRAYYIEKRRAMRPASPGPGTVGIAAWFDNYQPNPLGFALRLRATFLMQYDLADGRGDIEEALSLDVPYLEHGKPVKVELCWFPSTWNVRVDLYSLAFTDLFGNEVEIARDDEKVAAHALHGRLGCVWDTRSFRSDPEVRVRKRR